MSFAHKPEADSTHLKKVTFNVYEPVFARATGLRAIAKCGITNKLAKIKFFIAELIAVISVENSKPKMVDPFEALNSNFRAHFRGPEQSLASTSSAQLFDS
jgi:hypothetical protein